MIKELIVENFKSIKEKAVISANADARSKYLSCNYEDQGNRQILKSIGLFGANNSGKSSFADAFKYIFDVIKGKKMKGIHHNILNESSIISMSVEFSYGGSWHRYSFSFDEKKDRFLKESLVVITYRQNHTKKEETIFERDLEKVYFKSLAGNALNSEAEVKPDKSFVASYSKISNGNKRISNYIRKLKLLPDLVEVVSLENIDLDKTIEVLKEKNPKRKSMLMEFIKSTDPSITDFYLGDDPVAIDEDDPTRPSEDARRLKTRYGNVEVSSYQYDSSGLKKIEALGGYIIDALNNGKVLIIDELDNGLHFKLTRAIVSLFNNLANKKSQLFFITHDVTLLDTKYLLRKEQIYFVFKEDNSATFKRLSDFKANEGVRKDSDLLKRYRNNVFGLLPEPRFSTTLLSLITDEENKEDAD